MEEVDEEGNRLETVALDDEGDVRLLLQDLVREAEGGSNLTDLNRILDNENDIS